MEKGTARSEGAGGGPAGGAEVGEGKGRGGVGREGRREAMVGGGEGE